MLLSNEEVRKIFELTDDQWGEIKSILKDTGKLHAKASFTTSRGQETRDDIIKREKERYATTMAVLKEGGEKIEKILTPQQRAMLNKMKGKEFDTAKLIEEEFDAVILPPLMKTWSQRTDRLARANDAQNQRPPVALDEKAEQECALRRTWRLGIVLDVPKLSPQAVPYTVLDHDPVPAFAAQLKKMQPFNRRRLEQTDKQAERTSCAKGRWL